MFPLVEFPELVQHYAPFFEGVFSVEAFIEFQRYISGLVVRKTRPSTASIVCLYTRAAIRAVSTGFSLRAHSPWIR